MLVCCKNGDKKATGNTGRPLCAGACVLNCSHLKWFSGHELKPNGTGVFLRYRCVDPSVEAIHYTDCKSVNGMCVTDPCKNVHNLAECKDESTNNSLTKMQYDSIPLNNEIF